MDKEFAEKQKQKLLVERSDILSSLAGQNEQMAGLASNPESGDDADIASDTIDRTLLNSLGEADQRRLSMIDRALDRIRTDTYGLCLSCGKQIPQARLEALPYAVLCVGCQAKQDRQNR